MADKTKKNNFSYLLYLGFAFIIFCSHIIKAELVVQGTILGWNGKPLPLSHCFISNLEGYIEYSAPTNEDGNFKIITTLSGYILVTFTGVYHTADSVILYVPPNYPKSISIKARLKPIVVSDTITPTIVGNFEGSNNKNPLQMSKSADGNFFVEVKRNKKEKFLKYEIGGLVPNRFVNGTQADYFEYDGGKDYWSVIVSKDSIIKISFDPNKYAKVESPFKIEINDSVLNEFANVYLFLKKKRDEFSALEKLNSPNYQMANEISNFISHHLDTLSYLCQSQPNSYWNLLPLIDYATFSFIAFAKKLDYQIDKRLLEQIFNKISPSSPLWYKWSMEPSLPLVCLLLLNRTDSTSYIDSMIAMINSPSVKRKILDEAVTLYLGILNRKELGERYLDILTTKFPNTPESISAKRRYEKNIDSVYVQWKKILEKYEFKDLFSNNSFKLENLTQNKYLLIEFWATWCNPCIHLLNELSKIYPKYKDKLEILSVSIDEDFKKARQYVENMQKNGKLLWRHAIESSGMKNPIFANFNISYVPLSILISPEGKIIYSGSMVYFLFEDMVLAKYIK